MRPAFEAWPRVRMKRVRGVRKCNERAKKADKATAAAAARTLHGELEKQMRLGHGCTKLLS